MDNENDDVMDMLRHILEEYESGVSGSELSIDLFDLYLKTTDKLQECRYRYKLGKTNLEYVKAKCLQKQLSKGAKTTDARNHVTIHTRQEEIEVLKLEQDYKKQAMILDAIKELLFQIKIGDD